MPGIVGNFERSTRRSQKIHRQFRTNLLRLPMAAVLFLAAGSAFGQDALSLSSGSVLAGQTVSLDLSLDSPDQRRAGSAPMDVELSGCHLHFGHGRSGTGGGGRGEIRLMQRRLRVLHLHAVWSEQHHAEQRRGGYSDFYGVAGCRQHAGRYPTNEQHRGHARRYACKRRGNRWSGEYRFPVYPNRANLLAGQRSLPRAPPHAMSRCPLLLQPEG